MGNSIHLVFLLILLPFIISCGEDDTVDPTNNQTPLFTSTTDLKDFFSGDILGSTTIDRFEDKISINMNTSNLISGHVYNLVVITVDKPEKCQTSPCTYQDWNNLQSVIRAVGFFMTSWVAAGSTHTYGSSIKENDVTTIPTLLGGGTDDFGGLQDALKAEVHIFIRSRGPALPDTQQQLQTFYGDCSTQYVFGHPDAKVPTEFGECGWVQQSVHLSPPD